MCLAIVIQYNQITWNILNTGKHRKYHITNKLLPFEMKSHWCSLEVGLLASMPPMLATLMPQRKRLIYAMTNKHYRRNGFGSMNHKVLNCQFNIQTAGRQIKGDLVFSLLESCQSMYLTDNHKYWEWDFLVAIKCESSTNVAQQWVAPIFLDASLCRRLWKMSLIYPQHTVWYIFQPNMKERKNPTYK